MEVKLDKKKDQMLQRFILSTNMDPKDAIVYLQNEQWDFDKALDTLKKEKQIEENKNGGIFSGISNFFNKLNICNRNDDLILNDNNQNKKRENKDKSNNNVIVSPNNKNMGSNINNFNKENKYNYSSSMNSENLFENNNKNKISDNNIDNNFNNNNISYNSIKNDSIDEFNINTNSKKNNFNDSEMSSNNNSFFQDENLTTITFKFQDKKNPIVRKFLRSDTVQSLYEFINENLNNKSGKKKKNKFFLVRPYPYQMYNDKNKKLDEAGLDQNPTLHVREDD